jgi:hypothetical protein
MRGRRRQGWPPSLLAATVAFLAATAVLNVLVLPAPVLFLAMISVLIISIRLMPIRGAVTTVQIEYPSWDIPARAVVATVFVVALTAAAPLQLA